MVNSSLYFLTIQRMQVNLGEIKMKKREKIIKILSKGNTALTPELIAIKLKDSPENVKKILEDLVREGVAIKSYRAIVMGKSIYGYTIRNVNPF